ncbi:MAG: hypothetical protein CL886_03635 [Dehalococcoidia bacterium]|nr:hypothetical protein [Dehalococcoidia bacterium]
MPDFLKGNYQINNDNRDRPRETKSKSLTEEFEESALAKLGGSICFVSKSGNLMWDGDAEDPQSS